MLICVSKPARKNSVVCRSPLQKHHQHYRNRSVYALACPPSISVTEKKIRLSIDLPGINVKELTVKLESNTLTIIGSRHNRRFVRRFAFDSTVVDTSQLKANLADGVLLVTAPKIPSVDDLTVPISTNPHNEFSAHCSDITTHQKGGNKKEALLKMYLDVPGVKKTGLKVEVVDNQKSLRISGKRAGYPPFARKFAITKNMVDMTKVEGNLADGVLVLQFPPKNEHETNRKKNSINIAVTTKDHYEDDIACKF